MVAVVVSVCAQSLTLPDSYPRLHRTQGPPSVHLKIPKCTVQNDLLNERDALAERLGWVHLHVLRPQCQGLGRHTVQGHD